jgi:hypothetical protein
VSYYRVGVDYGSGISWGTAVAFDYWWSPNGILQLVAHAITTRPSSNHIAAIAFWDKILTDAQINGMGVP